MTPKWTIRKYPDKRIGDLIPVEWFAFAPGVKPTQTAQGAACLEEHEVLKERSLPELLEEIYTRERTVEVELPKVERKAYIDDDPFAELIAIEKLEYGAQITISDGSIAETFRLSGANLKPLGEYLLALHYEKENK